jgi:hypothetical protein
MENIFLLLKTKTFSALNLITALKQASLGLGFGPPAT